MHYALLLILIFMFSCSDSGVKPVDQKTVPNHTPQTRLQPVPLEEQASTAELLEMQQIRDKESMYRHLSVDPEIVPETLNAATSSETESFPIKQPETDLVDIRNLKPEKQAKTAREYRDSLLKRKVGTQIQPLPHPETIQTDGFNRETRRQPDLPRRADRRQPMQKGMKPNTPSRRNGGSRLFTPRIRQASDHQDVRSVIPPGRFFTAKLLGNVDVSLFSPTVFAEIYDPNGNAIGTAIGTATLHRALKDRALIRFGSLYLDDGRVISGDLNAFDLDKTMGLIGSVERQSWKQFAYAVAETFLGALSLEVETQGDSFGNVFKFQLADRLLDQANGRIRELDLNRQIHLERDLTFLVAGGEANVTRQVYSREMNEISTHARAALDTAIHSNNYTEARQRDLQSAYKRLNKRLEQLP